VCVVPLCRTSPTKALEPLTNIVGHLVKPFETKALLEIVEAVAVAE